MPRSPSSWPWPWSSASHQNTKKQTRRGRAGWQYELCCLFKRGCTSALIGDLEGLWNHRHPHTHVDHSTLFFSSAPLCILCTFYDMALHRAVGIIRAISQEVVPTTGLFAGEISSLICRRGKRDLPFLLTLTANKIDAIRRKKMPSFP